MIFLFDQNIFKKRLKSLRENKYTTLEKLAIELHSTKGTFSNLENGNKNPSINMIIKLADYFDVSTDYLLGRTDNPNSHKN